MGVYELFKVVFKNGYDFINGILIIVNIGIIKIFLKIMVLFIFWLIVYFLLYFLIFIRNRLINFDIIFEGFNLMCVILGFVIFWLIYFKWFWWCVNYCF